MGSTPTVTAPPGRRPRQGRDGSHVWRPVRPGARAPRGPGASWSGPGVPRVWRAGSATVCPGRARAKTTPQRRARSAGSRSWPLRLVAGEPSAAAPPPRPRCAPRGGTHAAPIARHTPWALRDAAGGWGSRRRTRPGTRSLSHAALHRPKRRPTHQGGGGLRRPGWTTGGGVPRGAPGLPSPHRGRRPFGGAGQGIKRAGAIQRTRRCPCPSVAGRRRPTRQAGRGAGVPLALASKGGRPGETAGLTRRQQRRRRGRPRHPVGMPRQSLGTKPGSAGQAILMGSAIASEETAPNVDAGWPQGAWTPFSFDLQGRDGLGCKF